LAVLTSSGATAACTPWLADKNEGAQRFRAQFPISNFNTTKFLDPKSNIQYQGLKSLNDVSSNNHNP
jgi:hypothetical protein